MKIIKADPAVSQELLQEKVTDSSASGYFLLFLRSNLYVRYANKSVPTAVSICQKSLQSIIIAPHLLSFICGEVWLTAVL